MTASTIAGIVITVAACAAWLGFQIWLYIKCGKDE